MDVMSRLAAAPPRLVSAALASAIFVAVAIIWLVFNCVS